MVMQIRHARMSIRAPRECDLSKRTVEGWASYFNDPQDHDTYNTVFRPEAFTRSVRLHNEGSYRIKVKDAHGRAVGVIEAIEIRDRGLWVSIRVEETPEGDLVLRKICEGTYDGLSIGFVNARQVALPDVSERTGKRVHAIVYAELVEVSILGDRSDHNARILRVRAAAGRQGMNCPCQQRGASLAAVLNTKIGVMEQEGASRDDVIAEVAAAAGTEAEEVSSILAGDVLEPEASTLEAFAEVTGVNMDTLVEAIDRDKMEGERASMSAEDKAPEADDQRASSRAADEMTMALDSIAEQVQRLREIVTAMAATDVVEITEELEAEAQERAARVERARKAASSDRSSSDAPTLNAGLEHLDRMLNAIESATTTN